MVPPIGTGSCPVPSEGRGAWPDSWYHPWFAAASRTLPCHLAAREDHARSGVPGNGGGRRRLLARGARVRGAARRSSRNGPGAVSQQHGSLETGGAFLPILVIALRFVPARTIRPCRTPIVRIPGGFVEGAATPGRSGGPALSCPSSVSAEYLPFTDIMLYSTYRPINVCSFFTISWLRGSGPRTGHGKETLPGWSPCIGNHREQGVR